MTVEYSIALDIIGHLDIEGSNVIGMTGMVRGKDSKAEEMLIVFVVLNKGLVPRILPFLYEGQHIETEF